MTWERKAITTIIPAHRTGWPGAWDAIVAAITGQPRLTVPTPYTFSVMVKVSKGAEVTLTAAQVETGEVDEREPMVPNPAQGLEVELPGIPGFSDTHHRIVASLTQAHMKESEARIITALKAEGAREERERLVAEGIFLVLDGPYSHRLITMADLEPKP